MKLGTNGIILSNLSRCLRARPEFRLVDQQKTLGVFLVTPEQEEVQVDAEHGL